MTDAACAICNRPYDNACIVAINGSKEKVDSLKERLACQKKAIKGRKRKLLEVTNKSRGRLQSTHSQDEAQLWPGP